MFGREYGIKGHGNAQYIQRLADYINEKAESIKRQSGVVSTMDLAILTLLNITDEQFRERDSRSGKGVRSEGYRQDFPETGRKRCSR